MRKYIKSIKLGEWIVDVVEKRKYESNSHED